MKKLTKNFTDASAAMLGKTFYLYDPFDVVIYEVWVRDIVENMFGEPDRVYTKIRMYADEKGIKNTQKDWSLEKMATSYAYLGNELTSKQEAIDALQTDLVQKQARLQEDIRVNREALLQIEKEKRAIDS
jgi:hypothetical protein